MASTISDVSGLVRRGCWVEGDASAEPPMEKEGRLADLSETKPFNFYNAKHNLPRHIGHHQLRQQSTLIFFDLWSELETSHVNAYSLC